METYLFSLSFLSGHLFFQIKNVDESIYILDVSVYWFFTVFSLFFWNLQDPEIIPNYRLQSQLAGQDYKDIISNISDR